MLELGSLDIDLLYKSLVLLPQDKPNTLKETEEEKPDLVQNKTAIDQKESSIIETQPAIAVASKVSKNTDSVAQEPKAEYKTEVRSLVVYTTATNKEKYLAEGSNFQKAITALKIIEVNKLLTSEDTILDKPNSYGCAWCIGIDLNTEKKILALQHNNTLISPDIESLTSVDEKKKMFSDLKAFVSSNIEAFSKI